MTWARCSLFSFSRSFTSRFQIGDPTNICAVAMLNPQISLKICPYFTAAQQIWVRSQIWMVEVKALVKLHNQHDHHVIIRSKLKNLTAIKLEGTVKLKPRSGSNPANTHGSVSSLRNILPRQSWSGFCIGLKPNQTDFLFPTRTTGRLPWPVANTNCTKDQYNRWYALWLWNLKNHWCENMATTLPQNLGSDRSCSQYLLQTSTDISAARTFHYRNSQLS